MFDGLGEEGSSADTLLAAEDFGAGSDCVQLEVSRWASLPAAKIQPFINEASGMLNEFQLLFSLKNEFPLHFFVFRRTCVHIGHEGNAEDTFSLSGSLSNENTHTAISFLSRLTRIQRNKARYTPPVSKVLDRYLTKFSKPTVGEDVEDVEMSGSEMESESESENAECEEGD
jgi:hypothetical protein